MFSRGREIHAPVPGNYAGQIREFAPGPRVICRTRKPNWPHGETLPAETMLNNFNTSSISKQSHIVAVTTMITVIITTMTINITIDTTDILFVVMLYFV